MIKNRSTLVTTEAKRLALDCIERAIHASHPTHTVHHSVERSGTKLSVAGESFDLSNFEDILVVGAGKASGRLAESFESKLGEWITDGLIITTEPVETDTISIVQGSHPIPSETNVEATEQILELLASADEKTLILLLISGGGSSLLCAPASPVSLSALQAVNESLLAEGVPIDDINAVRKHLSRVKGGQLATVADPATSVGIIMSDVVGDDCAVIASGPTVPDGTTFSDANAVFDSYGIDPPLSVRDRISAGVSCTIPETPPPDDTRFDTVTNVVLLDSGKPLRAAASLVRSRGYNPLVLGSHIRGESREVAKALVGIAEQIQSTGTPIAPPAVVLTGGETTVSITGSGTGGPNHECVVSAGLELPPGITLAAVDTDGIDGSTEMAGGIVDATTFSTTESALSALQHNNTGPFLTEHEAAIEMGPTGTNVNDFRVIVIEAEY